MKFISCSRFAPCKCSGQGQGKEAGRGLFLAFFQTSRVIKALLFFNTWLSSSPWASTSRQIEGGERSVHGYFYGLDTGEAYISPTLIQWLSRTQLATPNCVSIVSVVWLWTQKGGEIDWGWRPSQDLSWHFHAVSFGHRELSGKCRYRAAYVFTSVYTPWVCIRVCAHSISLDF